MTYCPGDILNPPQVIIDSHVHLMPSAQYFASEFLADLDSGHHIVAVVVVECGIGHDSATLDVLAAAEETRFIAREAEIIEGAGVRVGVVGHADLRAGAAINNLLDAHKQSCGARLKGIRQRAAHDPTGLIRSTGAAPPASLLSDPRFREGFAQLARSGLSFDAWVYFHQLSEVAALARSFPDTLIILNHLGGPLGVGPYSRHSQSSFDQWSAGVRDVARCSNVVVKLGGLGMSHVGFRFHRQEHSATVNQLSAAWRPYLETCIDAFGPSRAMFESNFPVDRTTCSYKRLWNVFKFLAESYNDDESRALLADTAARVYELDAA